MTNTPESGRAAIADSLHVTPETPDQQPASPNPLMAPEFAILRAVKLPLDPHSLPNLTLKSNSVIINLTALDSANSPAYQLAIAYLRDIGCTVAIDRESSESFIHIQITAPKSLFSTKVIATLEAKHKAEIIRSGLAEQARKAALETFSPEYGC